jgi:hypothetical protein
MSNASGFALVQAAWLAKHERTQKHDVVATGSLKGT